MENKKMVSFRLDPVCLQLLKDLTYKSGLSQAQVLELAICRLSNHCPYPADARKEYFRQMSAADISLPNKGLPS